MAEINAEIKALVKQAEQDVLDTFTRLSDIERENTRRVLDAFRAHRISLRHFNPTTGYGYDDIARDTLSDLFADIMGCEKALVRPQIVSGTHALSLCLYGILRPGQIMLAASGRPYDTLEDVIGLTGDTGSGSLREFGIGYKQIDMLQDGSLDDTAIVNAVQSDERIELVELQRSRGYAWRSSLSIEDMERISRKIHDVRPEIVVMVDNCYGEFTDIREPGAVGVDLLAGSLIKNPGGGLAPTGGYIAGRADLVDRVAFRLTSPGIGGEVGSYAASYQPFYQGLFVAPHVVMQAIRVAVLAARVFEMIGYPINPAPHASRSDIIQAIEFPNTEQLISFIQGIQFNSPVDSEAMPEPWDMPGYQDPVIMAAGTFVAGASIELSADAPVRPPYIAYLQGGLTYSHGYCAIEGALQYMYENGHLEL